MVVVVFISSRDLLSRVALPNVFIGACENMNRKETVRFTIPLVLLYIRAAYPVQRDSRPPLLRGFDLISDIPKREGGWVHCMAHCTVEYGILGKRGS